MTSTKVKINDLDLDSSPASTDELIFQKAGGGVTKKTTFADLPLDAVNLTGGPLPDSVVGESNVTQHEAAIDHDNLTNFVTNEHVDHSAVTITAGEGLTGGGTIAASRTFDLDFPGLTNITDIADTDEFAIHDATDATHKAVTWSALKAEIASEVITAETNDLTSAVTWANVPDTNITQSSVTQHEGAIDHDALTNFVANEHLDWTVDLGATNINVANIVNLTTSNFASSNVSQFTNDAGYITSTLTQEQVEDYAGALVATGGTKTGITITYQDTTGDMDFVVDHDAASNYVSNEHVDHSSVTITAGSGLSGGGTIEASRTIDLDIGGQTLVTAAAGDMVIIEDASDSNNIKRVDVSDFLSGGGGLNVDGTVRTSVFTATANTIYMCDTSGGAFTANFPASPSVGDRVGFADEAATFGTNGLTLGRNGSNVLGVAEDGLININEFSAVWMYYGATPGWKPIGIMPSGLSDEEVAAAYNTAVAVVSQSDAEAGTSTTAYRWTPQRVAQASGYRPWAVKTAAYTLVDRDQIISNTASAVTHTLPASPTAGMTVVIHNAGAGTVTVARNGSNINSTADDGELTTDNSTQLVYVDVTIGWKEI